ncbi:MAG: hypothetical protein PSV36_09840 [Algoriphagus sp.]|nr:hypothetical protein [Algoriphagus sp.]
MKNKILLSLFFWLFILIFSCKEKEKPTPGFGKISISGIDLTGSLSMPGGKVLTENSWTHVLQTSINLNFSELESGKTTTISINPNDFSKPYEVELALGTYSLTSTSTDPGFASYLPLVIDEQIQVGEQIQKIRLPAKTDFGLVTITKENLSNIPTLVSTPSVKFSEQSGFYYLYFKENQNLNFSFDLNQGKNSFRQSWKSAAFQHRHFTLDDPQKPEDVQTFKQTSFQLNQTTIPLATNGLPSALNPTTLANLPASQDETSGLAWIQNRLFSINDEDNTNQIFELNPETGNVIRTISVKNALNKDWEDLAQSDTHLFVGDFGNNLGKRTDLNILKIKITDLLNLTEVNFERIVFNFSDQTDFSGNNGNHNFNCEGFIFWNGKLHLFTKNPLDLKTNHYILSQEPGTRQAELNSTFDTQGLVTAAAIENNSNSLCLLGYENKGISSQVFIWLFSDYSGEDFFNGKKHKLLLGSPSQLSQTEGIIFQEGFTVLISGEKITLGSLSVPSRIHKIDLTGLF